MWAPHEQAVREIERSKKRVETIEHKSECSRLHIIDEGDGFMLWLDTDIGTEDGMVIGLGPTRREAIADAIEELEARLADLKALT